MTLPQMEEQSLYDQFEAGGAFEGQFRDSVCRAPRPNEGLNSRKDGISVPELMKTQLSILQCPSDESVMTLNTDQWQWRTCPVATTSYKGVLDDTWANEPPFGEGTFSNEVPAEYRSGNYTDPPPPGTAQHDCHRDTRCRGIFFRQSFQKPVTMAKVTDGASKTLVIGEDIPEYNRHSAAFYANGSWCSCNAPLNFGLGEDPARIAYDAWYDAQGFRSKHPGGAQFCLVDGSVRFISDSVDNILFRISCTRNGGESLGDNL
jgi:prepilin-type processing-associated H-X9-DG protein